MRTFTARSTFWFSVLVTTTTAGLLIAGGWLLHRQLIHSIELMHDVEGEELIGLIGSRETLTAEELAHRIKHDADSDAALFFIQVYHENGSLLFRSDNMGEAVLPSPFGEGERWKTTVEGLGVLWVSEYVASPWHIQIASRLAPVSRVLRDYAQVSALLLIGAALLSVAFGYGFSRFVLRPIRAIERTARQIRADNLGERIPVPPGRDELAALAGLLNQMFDRLQAAFMEVQRFTADASHELKTPLALIRLNAEKLRPRLGHDPGAQALIVDLLEQIGRLQRIIDHLLFLSKAEGGSLSLPMRPLALQPWVEDVAQDAQALAEDRGIRLSVVKNEAGEFVGEPHLLRQLVLNLVSNALRVVPSGGTVTLESVHANQAWHLTVTDEGPGLPPDQLERIFERFVRLPGPHEAEESRGHGLGLSICRSIVHLHGGTIRAVNRTDRSGLRLLVVFPASPSLSSIHHDEGIVGERRGEKTDSRTTPGAARV